MTKKIWNGSMEGNNMLIGGIEAGGTKIICGIGEWKEGNMKILSDMRFPTTTAAQVIPEMIAWFRQYDVKALGIASFGPLDLKKDSPTYGYIKATPKKGWQDVDFVGPFARALNVPIEFDTDVNGAALGEAIYGAGKNCEVAAYMTVGTGIGVGLFANGHLLHGMVHPEAGHMLNLRHPKDTYQGSCAFHHDTDGAGGCLEGYACGPAIAARWGAPGETLYDRKEVWEMEAYYLGQGVANLVLLYSPDRIIIGGGVMHQAQLFDMVRKETRKNVNGYIHSDLLDEKIDEYIVPPALGDHAGLMGALELGRRALVK